MSKKLIISRNYLDWDGPDKWMLRVEGQTESTEAKMVLTGPVRFVKTFDREDFETESGFGCGIVGVISPEQFALAPSGFMAIYLNDLKPLHLDIKKGSFTIDGQEVNRVASLLLLPDGSMYSVEHQARFRYSEKAEGEKAEGKWAMMSGTSMDPQPEPAKEADTLALVDTKPVR